MPNSIAQRQNYTNILDEVYQNAACSTCLNSGRGMVRAGAHAHEILIPKLSVTGLGNYTVERHTRRAISGLEMQIKSSTSAYAH